MYSVCAMFGSLATYKLFVLVYGRKPDGDIDGRHQNTETMQKWINLYSIMLDAFKGQGHCITMDSAYMGDIMALFGRHKWLINMVGTSKKPHRCRCKEEEEGNEDGKL